MIDEEAVRSRIADYKQQQVQVDCNRQLKRNLPLAAIWLWSWTDHL